MPFSNGTRKQARLLLGGSRSARFPGGTQPLNEPDGAHCYRTPSVLVATPDSGADGDDVFVSTSASTPACASAPVTPVIATLLSTTPVESPSFSSSLDGEDPEAVGSSPSSTEIICAICLMVLQRGTNSKDGYSLQRPPGSGQPLHSTRNHKKLNI